MTPSSWELIRRPWATSSSRWARVSITASIWLTGYEVARALLWTRRDRQLDELDPVNQMLAVIETRAHLELLVAQGRLTGSPEDGVTVYQVPRP